MLRFIWSTIKHPKWWRWYWYSYKCALEMRHLVEVAQIRFMEAVEIGRQRYER
jgi:hypothetical protein